MIIIIINYGNFFIAIGPTNPRGTLWQAFGDEFYLYLCLIYFYHTAAHLLKIQVCIEGLRRFKFYSQVLVGFSLFCYVRF